MVIALKHSAAIAQGFTVAALVLINIGKSIFD
jgi:hypothetical protein